MDKEQNIKPEAGRLLGEAPLLDANTEPTVTLTYKELEQVLARCISDVQSAPGEPPDGYDGAEEETIRIADECWHSGMTQLSNSVLNWAYDKLKASNNRISKYDDSDPSA